MALMHHNKLRVNAELPDDMPAETIEIYREHGWTNGLHKDTDPDDRWTDVPRVLPEPDPVPTVKADQKKKDT